MSLPRSPKPPRKLASLATSDLPSPPPRDVVVRSLAAITPPTTTCLEGAKYALFIAVEHYDDEKLLPVQFARNDAVALSKSLAGHGFVEDRQFLLLDEKATLSTVRYRLRKLCEALQPEDVLYVFYAGHGVALDGRNYLTCHDTRIDDLTETGLAVQDIFAQLQTSRCEHVVVFLDACHVGVSMDPSARSLLTELSQEDLLSVFKDSRYCVGFASCGSTEQSYSLKDIEHGIWTYHILQALNGNAPQAIFDGRYVTANSLQTYLAAAVPRMVRERLQSLRSQRPERFGRFSSDFHLVDLASLLAHRESARAQDEAKERAAAATRQFGRVVLSRAITQKVSALSGFDKKKGHFVPTAATDREHGFIARVAQQELNEDLENKYQGLREHFGYKKADLSTAVEGNDGHIRTPDFDYNVSVLVDADDPSRVIWRREISEVRSSDVVLSSNFDVVFGSFNRIEIVAPDGIEIDALIDRIEADTPAGWTLRDDREATYCEIHIDGIEPFIRLEPGTWYIVHPRPASTRVLLESYQRLTTVLVGAAPTRALLASRMPAPQRDE